jgi:hypothetical protein
LNPRSLSHARWHSQYFAIGSGSALRRSAPVSSTHANVSGFAVNLTVTTDFPAAWLLRHKKGQLAVGLWLIVLRVLKQVAHNSLAPAARTHVIRGRMWVGLRVTQWTRLLHAWLSGASRKFRARFRRQ